MIQSLPSSYCNEQTVKNKQDIALMVIMTTANCPGDALVTIWKEGMLPSLGHPAIKTL